MIKFIWKKFDWVHEIIKIPSVTKAMNNPNDTCDDILTLYPLFREKIEQLLKLANKAGLRIVIYETWRSQQRQFHLFRIGRTKLKSNGMHYFGLACDIVFVDKNNKPTWTEPYMGAWERLGGLGESLGLTWGGRFKNKKGRPWPDKAHFQLIPTKEQGKLMSGFYPEEIKEVA